MYIDSDCIFHIIVIILIRNNIKIYLATPVQLLGNQHRGEGEPKNRYLFLLLGFILLGAGYAIALTISRHIKFIGSISSQLRY